MRRINQLLTPHAFLTALLIWSMIFGVTQSVVSAEATNAPSLTISQLKITSSNGQFITLYNATNTTLDMSKFQLEYFNSYDLGKATSSRLLPLSGSLPSHGYYMVSDDSLLLCYQMSVASLSLGFSSTAGMVEVLGFNQQAAGGSVVPSLQDYVSWSKTAVPGVQTLPSATNASLLRQPVDAAKNPQITLAGAGSWQTVQPDPTNACNLITYSGTIAQPIINGQPLLRRGAEPQATVLEGNGSDPLVAAASMPAADVGLLAPRITEILPNPDGTGNDATDEFIELYNPNPVGFDLSGFSLQVGTTSTHSFKFPAGTQLPAQGYQAFYSVDTGLSLSNTSGAAALLDPFGNSLSATEPYSAAKDGQSWALANGAWSWTTRLTPGAANIVIKPVAAKKGTKTVATKKAATAVKKTSSKPAKLTAATVSKHSDAAPLTPIHPQTLVIVAVIALLYGAYEYRTDITNRIYQLGGYARLRRGTRSTNEGR